MSLGRALQGTEMTPYGRLPLQDEDPIGFLSQSRFEVVVGLGSGDGEINVVLAKVEGGLALENLGY